MGYGNFNGYGYGYGNQYFSQPMQPMQQMSMPMQNMQQPMQPMQNVQRVPELQGKTVDSIDVVKAMEIPLNRKHFLFSVS